MRILLHPMSRPAALYATRLHLGPVALLLATTALTSPLFTTAALAQTLPTGASVAAGSVAISQPSATNLTVTQSSQSAVVNYQSFSVGQGNSVNFVQPNASSAILNRVTGNASSNIAGSITANGSVYLVNPNGIAITRSGTVNAGGGFVASTLGISDSDFMSGKRSFTGNGASANVSNAGTISVGRGGYAALIGGTVSNSGSINVPLGKVGLGSGERATLDFAGDGFLQVAMPTANTSKRALIRNSGTIKADGGSVIISAATAREAARNAINISGTVQARSISGHNGSITIGGGAGGRVKIAGRIDASSRRHAGGSIVVTGQSIKLKGATIDASGKTGGGSINIGGGRQGTGSLQHADTVSIDGKTTIKADATQTGNGGNVVVWSDDLTTFAGTISAKGGALSGNGGEAEVSGKAKLAYSGLTNLTAANGRFGTLLLDPYNVTISNGTQTTDANFSASANDSIINATTLNSQLANSSVTITTGAIGSAGGQAGNITVAAPITWSSGTMLTLTAANAIAVNAGININGGGQLALNAATQPHVSFGTNASVNFASGQSGQALTINTQPYTLVSTINQLQAINADLSANYALAQNLDATGVTGFTPIGVSAAFVGTFNGLGHVISNLTITSAAPYVGLFGQVGGASAIENVGLVGGSVTATASTNPGPRVGALVGFHTAGTITQVYATGTVNGSGNGSVGGLVGYNAGSGTISLSYATGAVSGGDGDVTGGLVGYGNGGTISLSYATGAVSASGYGTVGGLVGQNYKTISLSYATGKVTGVGNHASVGGLVGYNDPDRPGTVTYSYYDTSTGATSDSEAARASSATGSVNGYDPTTGSIGLTTAQLAAALPAGFVSTVWGNAGNKTTPYLLNNIGPVFLGSDSSTTPAVYTPILTQAGLEAVNRNTSANYVLANNLDLTGTTYTGPVIGSFSGTLDGFGHTISNLTIDAPITDNVGLIGSLSLGTVRNVGIVGGSVTGRNNVGALVGNMGASTVTQSFTTATVFSSGQYVGGLVGFKNGGTIAQSYATGAVSGNNNVGGLLGINFRGSVMQSYATGAVTSAPGNSAGALVGLNRAQQGPNVVSQSYFDNQTSGQAAIGSGAGIVTNVSGYTTRQLQGLDPLPSGTITDAQHLGAAFAGGTGGLYPYLTTFAPNGVQAFSGTAYRDAGLTPLASNGNGAVSVNLIANGTLVGSATTGANGYYYLAVPMPAPFTPVVANQSNLLAYNTATSAARLVTASGGALQTGLNLYSNTLAVETSATSFSNAPQTASAARTANATALSNAAGGNANAMAAYTNATGLGLISFGSAGFNINTTPTLNGTFVIETCACAPLTVSAPITVAAGQNLGLLSGGALKINANVTVNGAGSVALTAGNRAILDNTGAVVANVLDMGFGNGASIEYGATDQGGKLAVNGTPYTLVYTMQQLDALDGVDAATGNNVSAFGTGLGGNYAIATNLTSGNYAHAVVGSFSGTLEGLGHTIGNLTITSVDGNVGLIGSLSGTVRDLGLVGGAVSSSGDAVGSLVGSSGGTIFRTSASVTVNGGGRTGGLVGYNIIGSSIAQSYATGAVTGNAGVGGLVGSNNGLVAQTFATGAINGTNAVGGLVGLSNGYINQSYATGAVTGTRNAGGLVGLGASFLIANSTFDTQTSGLTNYGNSGGNPSFDISGMTTAQLQGALPSGFDATVWGTGTGLYPYLTSFFPTAPQAVSGVVYTNAGATPLAGGSVSVVANGAAFGSVTTGANGYYYAFGQPGSFTSGSSLLAYTQQSNATGAKDAATYTVATTNLTTATGTDLNNTGVNIYGGWKLDRPASSVTTLSALNAFETLAARSSPAATFSLANRDIRIASSAFSLDTATSLSGTLALDSTGTVTQSNGGTITAGALRLSGSSGAFTLTNAGNAVGSIAAATGSVSLVDSVALTTGSIGNASGTAVAGVTTSGAVTLATTGNLKLASGAAVNGTSPVLSTGGVFTNDAGSAGIVATGGTRFLLWSQNPAIDLVRNLAYDFKQYNAPFGTTPAQTTGNGLLYALPQTVTLGASGSFDKDYDKTATTRLLTGGSAFIPPVGLYIFSGGVTGDTVTAKAGATGTFGSVNAGTAIPVSIDSSAVTFVDAGGHPVYGYQVASNITGNINRKLLSIDLSVASKVYDGTGNANFVLSSRDVVAGDIVTFTPAQSPRFGNINVGSYTLQATNISVGGQDGANYRVSNSGAAANASITPRPLTITANAQSRIYGDPNPALTYTLGGMGLANRDTLTGALATTATIASSVGNYAITQDTLTIANDQRPSNYLITYIGANLSVTPAPVVVTAPPVGGPTASTVMNDNFIPISLPNDATPVFGAPLVLSAQGTGILYSDPRNAVFVCFGGGFGTAPSCYAAGR